MPTTKPQRGWNVSLTAAACVVFVGCAGGVDAEETHDDVGRAIQPIVGGTTSGANQDAVVLLARFASGVRQSLCTATLVAPNLALTARHCVSQTDSVAGCAPDGTAATGAVVHTDYPASSLAVYAAKDGATADSTDEKKASAHGATLVVDDATTICDHDAAFVVLDRVVEGGLAPIRLGPPTKADALTAVGFGVVDTGALPATRMQRADVTLLAGVGPWAFPEDPRYGAGPAEAAVGESACAGDSGSPLLAKSGAVVGVASRAGNGKPRDPSNIASSCTGDTAHVVYTHLDAAKPLVMRAFATAGHAPWLEGEPDPRLALRGHAPCAGVSACDDVRRAAPALSTTATEIAPEDDAGSESSGCSASPEGPDLGAVERAAGAVALLGTILRRLRRRRTDALTETGDGARS